MRVDAFDFDLPDESIALRPARPRDAARMLDVADDGAFEDAIVRDLPNRLRAGDLLVLNTARVIPARLTGFRAAREASVTGEPIRIEINLSGRESDDAWAAFIRPAKRLRPGDVIHIAEGFEARIEERRDEGAALLRFNLSGAAFDKALRVHGEAPLPPYIARQRDIDAADADDYQTVYARKDGAVAAPTAGLHFTPPLFDALDARGVGRAEATLLVGAGTFLPVKADDTRDHKMHAEYGEIDEETAAAVNAARAAGGRIVAVGTTSLRLLETAAREDGSIAPFQGQTDIFITPGYRFRAVDILLTNFHLPRSTLFMLVSAFSGLDRMRAAYEHAIASGYRFYSYGDACLLHRADDAS